jgi:hypothetical protein
VDDSVDGLGTVAAAGSDRPQARALSWVRTAAEIAPRREHAARLIGERLVEVRYYDIDYTRWTVAPEYRGHRLIEQEAEWLDPSWRCEGFDAVDHGIELETDAGRVFSVTWDPPGDQEGIGLQELPLAGISVCVQADIAVWPVGRPGRWRDVLGQQIRDVQLHYQPWDQQSWDDADAFWCPRITLVWAHTQIDVVLGDWDAEGRFRSSADNLAVVFDPGGLPDWLDIPPR